MKYLAIVSAKNAYVMALSAYHCLHTVTSTTLLDLMGELQLYANDGQTSSLTRVCWSSKARMKQVPRLTLSSSQVDPIPAKSRRPNRACLNVEIYLPCRHDGDFDC